MKKKHKIKTKNSKIRLTIKLNFLKITMARGAKSHRAVGVKHFMNKANRNG